MLSARNNLELSGYQESPTVVTDGRSIFKIPFKGTEITD
jgi:hypothetical protein